MHRCYRELKKVPAGKVTTYKALAQQIDLHPRAIGKLMHDNPHAPEIPCHRVVRTDGTLGGYAKGVAVKERLLKQEGVVVSDGKIDLHHYGYFFD